MTYIKSSSLTNDGLINSFPKILEQVHENTLGGALTQNSSQVFLLEVIYMTVFCRKFVL